MTVGPTFSNKSYFSERYFSVIKMTHYKSYSSLNFCDSGRYCFDHLVSSNQTVDLV